MGNLKHQLSHFIHPERILTRYIDRIAYASDASVYRLIPQAVVQPVSDSEIQRLFQFSKQQNIPITFRAAGTSLSGQSISDGILVDVSKFWRGVSVEKEGTQVRVQPGVIGSVVNHSLKSYQKKIGPDPASINAAMMGGILANNSSGMCCGVVHNSYHTLASMKFILPDGEIYDTAIASDRIRFEDSEIGKELLSIKNSVLNNTHLSEKIRTKYQIKNTVGYSLNSFLDYSYPIDIFSHLLIGSEGTLGFISEAVLNTIPDYSHKVTGLIYFANLFEACSAIVPLRDCGASALELMDYASLKSVQHLPEAPKEFKILEKDFCALLIEFQGSTLEFIQNKISEVIPIINQFDFHHSVRLSIDPDERDSLWKIRKGMFPSVGSVRKQGTSVIIEDLVFPVIHLAEATVELQQLFKKHGYDNAIIFGHAKDGNIHFVITQSFNEQSEIDRYESFMSDVVELTVNKFNGSLKGEHGTGRNISPFLETEWGSEAYQIMKSIKLLVDPQNILNPRVIINLDPKSHITNLKSLPEIESEVDKCIECGYCESKCPSRDLTLTPRQRIVVRREMERLQNNHGEQSLFLFDELNHDFEYSGLETCATDGLCATACPVDIDTGKLVKRLRNENKSDFENWFSVQVATHFSLAEKLARLILWKGNWVNRLLGKNSMNLLSEFAHDLFPAIPIWLSSLPKPVPQQILRKLSNQEKNEFQFLYFPTCISRNMGNYRSGFSIPETILVLSNRANIKLRVSENNSGYCCGTPFSSKGYLDAYHQMLNSTIEFLWFESFEGILPILIDTSPCTFTFKTCINDLTESNKIRYRQLVFIDSIEFVADYLLPKLDIKKTDDKIVMHPVCSVVKMKLSGKLNSIGEACSSKCDVPPSSGCCGMAGDRGMLFPELIDSATKKEIEEINSGNYSAFYSSSRTCELALTESSGKEFESVLRLVERVSR